MNVRVNGRMVADRSHTYRRARARRTRWRAAGSRTRRSAGSFPGTYVLVPFCKPLSRVHTHHRIPTPPHAHAQLLPAHLLARGGGGPRGAAVFGARFIPGDLQRRGAGPAGQGPAVSLRSFVCVYVCGCVCVLVPSIDPPPPQTQPGTSWSSRSPPTKACTRRTSLPTSSSPPRRRSACCSAGNATAPRAPRS